MTMTGPAFCGGWPFATGVFGAVGDVFAGNPGFGAAPGLAAGPGVAADPGFRAGVTGAGGDGGVSRYFSTKSETMSRFSETFAFN